MLLIFMVSTARISFDMFGTTGEGDYKYLKGPLLGVEA